MKELDFTHHNNGYSLIKGFGMINHGDTMDEPERTHKAILSLEQSLYNIYRRMDRMERPDYGCEYFTHFNDERRWTLSHLK